MKNINKMKEIARNNTGACGDAQASSNSLCVVCWDLSTGFQFDIYIDGVQKFGLSECEIELLMVSHNCHPRVGVDLRGFAG